MEIRLTEEKLREIRDLLQEFLSKKKVTLLQLQSLIGLLNFACAAVVPGRTFLRRLIDFTIGLTKPHHFRRLTKEAKADLLVWKTLCANFNGKCVIFAIFLGILLNTDASNIGFGGYLGSNGLLNVGLKIGLSFILL